MDRAGDRCTRPHRPAGQHRPNTPFPHRQQWFARTAAGEPARHLEAYAAEQAAITAVGERPILFLHGTDDGSIGSDVIHNPKVHLPQGSRVERIDDAATFSNLEQPERIKREVLAWPAG
ncbi:alpha/beta fold hydrolase [Streptomyces canus]|uniref:alpha/beta fold hydrolase n=1 Tax=Streptomyces canus TaxID=58343 RepID=UPI000748CED2|nr:alpha/beta hydrolase [Streptomyces canus]KUN04721.1 hypothetical protein AQI96_35820 [Streptomyces canus]